MNDPQPEGHMASHIGRRKFLATLGGAAASWPLAARAQQRDRMRRLGVLMGSPNDSVGHANATALVQGLSALGWQEGSNLRIALRWCGGEQARSRLCSRTSPTRSAKASSAAWRTPAARLRASATTTHRWPANG